MRILLRVGVVLLLAVATVLLFARGQDDWLILALVGCAVVALVVDRWVRRTEPDDLAEDDLDDEIVTGEIEQVPDGLEAIPEARIDEVPEAAPGALRAELHESVAGEPFGDAEPAAQAEEAVEFEETAESAGDENGAAGETAAPPDADDRESSGPQALAERER